ncbi:MAG: alpha/beta hydrolase [Deltaproteobacteria bacterium]|nr:alpha/beta hydrolase [Deltaproteobacteria bacterium]
MKLHTFTRGDRSLPAVVLVHGLLGGARNLRRLQEKIAGAGYFTVAYDQRGHGHSPHFQPDQYALGFLASDLLGILDGEGLRAAHLVGHSLGGRVCVLAAAKAPERTLSVSLLDVGTQTNARGMAALHAIIDPLPESFVSKEEARAFLAANLPLQGRERAVFEQFLLSNLRSRDGRMRWIFDLRGVRESLLDSLKIDHSDAWSSLRAPLLVAKGAESRHFTSEEHDAMSRKNPRAELAVIPGAGHWVHVDNLDGTFEAVHALLERVKRQ